MFQYIRKYCVFANTQYALVNTRFSFSELTLNALGQWYSNWGPRPTSGPRGNCKGGGMVLKSHLALSSIEPRQDKLVKSKQAHSSH